MTRSWPLYPVAVPVSDSIWWLLGAEIALAVLGDALSRATALCDSLLGDRFTNHVSLRMMAHATELDLVSFEDPVFYDKMERARRQTSSRLGMLASLASMAQQLITLLSLSAGIVAFSPWLLLVGDCCRCAVVPRARRNSPCSRTRFSFNGHRNAANSIICVCSAQATASAKEVKIFGLGDHLTERAGFCSIDFRDNRATGNQARLHGNTAEYSPHSRLLHCLRLHPVSCAFGHIDGR